MTEPRRVRVEVTGVGSTPIGDVVAFAVAWMRGHMAGEWEWTTVEHVDDVWTIGFVQVQDARRRIRGGAVMDHYSGSDPATGCAVVGLYGVSFIWGAILTAIGFTVGPLAAFGVAIGTVVAVGVLIGLSARGSRS